MTKKLNFLSNYGLVLTHLYQDPRATLRETARATGLTERAVFQIIREMEESGIIEKKRLGRRNTYAVNRPVLLRFPVYQDVSVAQIADAVRRIIEQQQIPPAGQPPAP